MAASASLTSGRLNKPLLKGTMGKRLTPEEKQQHVVNQNLTPQQINRLENNPAARAITQAELNALVEARRAKSIA